MPVSPNTIIEMMHTASVPIKKALVFLSTLGRVAIYPKKTMLAIKENNKSRASRELRNIVRRCEAKEFAKELLSISTPWE